MKWWRRNESASGPIAADAAKPAADPWKPTVRLPRNGLSGGALAAGAAVGALCLFSVLEARRTTHVEPSVRPQLADGGYTIAPPAPLQIPPEPAVLVAVAAPAANAPMQAAPPPMQPKSAYAAQPISMPPPTPPAPPIYPQPPAPPAPAVGPPNRNGSALALVIDTTAGTAGATTAGAMGPAGASPLAAVATGNARARSGTLANRSNTVPQGTLIPAVLETAFDSTRPGFARAIVSRDVRGFDGSKVLIPRGSRLIGDYQSDVSPGQKRAVITWTRLIRPDGAVIALESPAVDPLGRGGVHASVNSHLPERVLGALLQSTLQVGSLIATRAATGSVILALPGAAQNSVGPQITPATIVPTLRVPAATSISIFAARDLEFAGEDQE